jgi:lysophospholipase L1-like esterase
VTVTVRAAAPRIAIWATAASADCYYDVVVDGAAPVVLRLPAGQAETVLAEGLDPQVIHRVDLTRRTESWMGIVTLHEVRVAGGTLHPAPPAPAARLLFIGDSITCGACVDCLPPDFPAGHETANAPGSFGMLVGRRLGAQVHLVSYGGRGLMRDYLGLGNDAIANAPVFFERALPDAPDAQWDHTSYHPAAIVVGLGTNDFSLGIPEASAWTDAYVHFARRLRAAHPTAQILLTTSPMIGQRVDNGDAAKAAALATYLTTVVRRRSAEGDRGISWLRLPYAQGQRNSHPDAPGHRLIADALEPVLRPWCAATNA